MSFNRHQKIGIALLAIPFLVMLLMIATNMRHLSHQEYRIAIEGYDPRDLLKGHYMVFRYQWPEGTQDMFADNTYPRTDAVCACLSGDPVSPQVRFDACVSIHPRHKICEGAVKVTGGAGFAGYQPADELRRYFIPEEHAADLEKMLRSSTYKFEVGIVPREGGQAQLKTLYIDGMSLDKFIEQKLPHPPSILGIR